MNSELQMPVGIVVMYMDHNGFYCIKENLSWLTPGTSHPGRLPLSPSFKFEVDDISVHFLSTFVNCSQPSSLAQPCAALLSLSQPHQTFSAFLSLTSPFSAFLSLSKAYSTFFGLTQPYSAFLCLSEPYSALLSLSQPYSAFLNLTQPFSAALLQAPFD